MKAEMEPPIRRVMSSNGRFWQTNANGAADYIFNPVFMTFFILCVVLYATLMQPSEETSLPIPAQMILWGGLIMTSLVWLVVSVWLSVHAFDRGIIKAIYTPFILLPLVLINTVLGEFVLSVFNTNFQGSYGSALENIIQNVIILCAFDIMHERFVAPQHPRYVPRRTGITPAATMSAQTLPVDFGDTANAPAATEQVPLPDELPVRPPHSDAEGSSVTNFITISNETIDVSAIRWMRSEDHYLNIQLKNRSLMLRGKLRSVVKELGDTIGAQINRSVWVAFSAVRRLDEQQNGVFEVHLDDDTVLRIANSRRLIFKQNYGHFKATRCPQAKISNPSFEPASDRTRDAET